MATAFEFATLSNGLRVCRVTSGLWQLSGAHGYEPDLAASVRDAAALIRMGFTTFDLADHYGVAEDVVGALREAHPDLAAEAVFMTKWVPAPGPMPVETVRAAFGVSRRRMRADALDLVALHWWDYADRRWMDMARAADALSEPDAAGRPGVVSPPGVALTNFDTERVRAMLDAGVRVVSNQVSFSVVDTRPLNGMVPLAAERRVSLMCYGALLGGLLSDAWIGRPEPRSRAELPTASLGKYYRFVREWGGWPLFQELLAVMRRVATRHGVDVASVAVRWVLQQRAVANVLVGMRLGLPGTLDHARDNAARVFSFRLDEEDMAAIAAVQARARGLRGDCGDEYR